MNSSKLSEILTQLLPSLQPCKKLVLGKGDLLIHAPGFEDRTIAVTQLLEVPDASNAILLDYEPFDPANRLPDVRRALTQKRVLVSDEDIIKYHRFEPGNFEVRLRERLLAHNVRRVIVDISTMSKLAIMMILNVCHATELSLSIVYAEAEQYGPKKEEFERAVKENEIHQPTLQVFTGVYGVVRVDSLASVAMQGQPAAALVFMSFNDALTQTLLNTVYPSRLFLINGRPPIHRWRECATAWIHEQVRREWEEDNPVDFSSEHQQLLPKRVVSTLDYKETVLLLLDLYWGLSTHHRLLLAPAGSKLQAVGCFIVRALHPDIHVEYPSPEGFLSRYYSVGIARCWLLDIGPISKLLSAVSKVEREAYLEIPV